MTSSSGRHDYAKSLRTTAVGKPSKASLVFHPLITALSIKLDFALNTPFSDWGNILFNTTIATAIADRLVENSEIFLLGGDSLRKANRNSAPPEE
jgi:DNA replication protein DnaC